MSTSAEIHNPEDRSYVVNWELPQAHAVRAPISYVAVGGNTGSGKSTLVHHISALLTDRFGRKVVGINERTFHHPLLPKMFSSPGDYAFPVQLNFLLQRWFFLRHCMAINQPVVMERSHWEDILFVEHHYESGNISYLQFDAYCALRAILLRELPAPDIYVRINATPDVSVSRILGDEDAGRRPREFPNEETLRAFVVTWHERYKRLFDDFDRSPQNYDLVGTAFVDCDPDESVQESIEKVQRIVEGVAGGR